ncbi:MAG: phosphoglycerate dehydrogenase [Thaumarchaeota archaeon]|nr:phosphoglycerate dehydrogenase [Nitrososphaerota archaeon]
MPAPPRVFVTCRTCGQTLLDALSRLGTVVPSPFRSSRILSEDELLAHIPGASVVVAGTDPFTRRVVEAGARSGLKLIARYGIGLDNIDLKAATKNSVLVTYAPKASSVSVAEFTIALTLSLLRRIPEADSSVRAAKWPQGSMRGSEVAGKTVGIVGLGTIGRRVAEVFEAMGAKVIAYDPFVKGDPRLRDLDAILREADIISIHSALNAGSQNLIGAAELSRVKPSAVLVNTARGAVVNQKALYSALIERRLGGVALDVFEVEPPQLSDTLAKLPNVILTPHIAGNTTEASERTDRVILEDVERFLRGLAPVYPANPEVVTSLGLR